MSPVHRLPREDHTHRKSIFLHILCAVAPNTCWTQSCVLCQLVPSLGWMLSPDALWSSLLQFSMMVARARC